ncbi:MAG TPA: 16S rRNA (cytosine(967)-C(5))-methyltransferase RsmB, partial [Nevskiaceae bacterium]|nr:16S rRNA (cytosine(967)-C(5))-methyltransferase RsmB [Nevskiaceae bacterium]
PMKPEANPRVQAARAVARVMAGASLDDALARIDARAISPQDLSLAKAIAYGVVREHRLLGDLATRLLERPIKNAPEAQALLLCGLYQLRSMRIAEHAAVGETVEAVALIGKPSLRGLVNAVLRRYQREKEGLEAVLPRQPAAQYSYAEWMAERIAQDWGTQAPAVLAAGNAQAPLTLRVNRRKITREAYQLKLAVTGIPAHEVAHAPDAVALEAALPVEDVPGFDNGLVSVQDASAQLAAELLALQPGQRVLDACAAPGGKTAHLLEHADVQVLALDRDAERTRRIGQNLDRLDLQAEVVTADAADPAAWWDGKPFERILLDAPCSGTGVIRRHPDIKWLRRPSDIPRMAAQQQALLDALWPALAPGGLLLYAVCSIFSAESESVLKNFLVGHADARRLVIDTPWGEACKVGRRIAPGGDFDGFYYARLQKPAR